MNTYFIYILSSPNKSVLYIGVTNYLQRRIAEHKSKMFEGFSKKYNCTDLVYFEKHNQIEKAILREKSKAHFFLKVLIQNRRSVFAKLKDFYHLRKFFKSLSQHSPSRWVFTNELKLLLAQLVFNVGHGRSLCDMFER